MFLKKKKAKEEYISPPMKGASLQELIAYAKYMYPIGTVIDYSNVTSTIDRNSYTIEREPYQWNTSRRSQGISLAGASNGCVILHECGTWSNIVKQK